jgi:putative CocE/NonD family hydrolase
LHRTLTFASAALAVALATSLDARPAMASAFSGTTDYNPHLASAATAGVTCTTQSVPMRDGTLLTTDIYKPPAAGTYPVILERTPYGTLFGFGCFSPEEQAFSQWAAHGYVAVLQEVRGTGTSGGHFNAVVQEVNDQYDATEWAAAQPWSTGKVGTTGGSYLGIDQWAGALSAPPHLYAIAPDIAASDGHDSPTYENGVFRVSDMLQYGAIFAPDAYLHLAPPSQPLATTEQQIGAFEALEAKDLTSWLYTVPLDRMSAIEGLSDWYYTWLANPNYDSYWASQDLETHYPIIKVPALIGGASIDLFNIGAIRNFQGMRASAGTPEARAGTKLYWQAYGHAGDSGTPTFGNDAAVWATTASGIQLGFFDHYLKGKNNGYEASPNVHLYVLVPPNKGENGSGFWISGANFPLPGTRDYRFYLGSGGNANTRFGDGYMLSYDFERSQMQPRSVGTTVDTFTYDPSKPVPTVGGNMLFKDPLNGRTGFQDQSGVEMRKDVLVYTSAPLTSDLAVIGTVKASFWAMTDARDTDFTIKLVDVHPDGLTHNLMDRVVRARYRLGSKLPPTLVHPNVPYQNTLDIGNTATILRTGHRIRVEISSSNFPKFSRNLNTVPSAELQQQSVVAHQTVLHDFAHPSFVDLPVAPNVAIP